MAELSAYTNGGLGASIGDEIDKLISAGKARQIGTSVTLPPGVEEVTIDQLSRVFDPWFKKWWIWAGAGVALAGGTYFILRRRRRSS